MLPRRLAQIVRGGQYLNSRRVHDSRDSNTHVACYMERTMRILLIQPRLQSERLGFQLVAQPEPLALELLAAMVPDHDVAIVDMRMGDDLDEALNRLHPDVVAATSLTTEVYNVQAILKTAKEHHSEIFTVVGGLHASLVPEDFFLPSIDAVCLGEGEAVFPKLIEARSTRRKLNDIPNLIWQDADGQFINNGRDRVQIDADSVPLPRRDLVERHRENYFFLFGRPDSYVATSRGCPYRCNFCSVWKFYDGRTCQMSPGRVVEDIRAVTTEHIALADDNFLMNARREHAIADQLRQEGLAHRYMMECRTDSIVRHPDLVEKWTDIGLRTVLLGLEGATDQALKDVNKKNNVRVNEKAIHILHENGIMIWGAFIVNPDWEADDFKRLWEYVQQQGITHTQYTVLTPLPGTPLYQEKYDQLLTHDYTCFDTLHAVLPTRLPRDEFYQRYAGLYKQADLLQYYDLVRRGQLSVDDVRQGHKIYLAMSDWELYADNDPVLRQTNGRPSL